MGLPSLVFLTTTITLAFLLLVETPTAAEKSSFLCGIYPDVIGSIQASIPYIKLHNHLICVPNEDVGNEGFGYARSKLASLALAQTDFSPAIVLVIFFTEKL